MPPKEVVPLRLDQEVRRIQAGLHRVFHRERFIVEYESVAYLRDAQQDMPDYELPVVYLYGYGWANKNLSLKGKNGRVKLVRSKVLANLFGLFANSCVVAW